jgi:serine/threonine-protein kinase
MDTPTSAPTETSVKSEPVASPHPSLDEARFIPGTLLAKRYRIVGLLGRGGMGEVYRADDLKLGQPVALKFLPPEVQRDRVRLERFLNEVKTAFKVTHPNVCRVHDIGEFDGQHYLSMEYVDGEDLASLLRRIERLPENKAVQIARQLCAGLAAAHEQGILHRDLKPANIMIDGRGRAKITDFGLAGLAESIEGDDVRAGTPLYMAPEQLTGKEVTVSSDLYSLGLVFYELFTGKRAFTGATAAEIQRLQLESTPASPTRHVAGLDPAVERVVLRCLDRDPRLRPVSALEVAAALPGGDPLAAALAAGETPSPQMVAAAGGDEALTLSVAVPCLLLTLFGLVLMAFLHGKTTVLGHTPTDKSPDVLVERAREIVRALGHEAPPADTGHGFHVYRSYLRYLKDQDSSMSRWARAATRRPTPLMLWYRQGPERLVPEDVSGKLSAWDPWPHTPGMVVVFLDANGWLEFFLAVPPRRDLSDEPAAQPDWKILFAEAGLDPADFIEARPEWTPFTYCDNRAAWTGSYPGQPEPEIRVEACAYRGIPVSFDITHPWSASYLEPAEKTARQWVREITWWILQAAVVVGALVLARRNLRLGRGDRKGAFRLAVFVLSPGMLAWLLSASHVAELAREKGLLVHKLGSALYGAAYIWVAYMALEPFVRRRWPDTIVSWSRLLSGRFRDPLVGRHVLYGAAVGIGMELVEACAYRGIPVSFDNLRDPFFFVVLIALGRVVVRKLWIAVPLLIVLYSMMASLRSEYVLVTFLTWVLWLSLGLW